jgi:hypothetical protein
MRPIPLGGGTPSGICPTRGSAGLAEDQRLARVEAVKCPDRPGIVFAQRDHASENRTPVVRIAGALTRDLGPAGAGAALDQGLVLSGSRIDVCADRPAWRDRVEKVVRAGRSERTNVSQTLAVSTRGSGNRARRAK